MTAVLEGPVLLILLRLGIPTLIVLVVQTLVGVIETYFVSFLGTEAIAGVALVFPVLMLMQMMANGGMGGGVSSAVARALGAGKPDDAAAVLWHALLLSVVFGIAFTALPLLFGPALLPVAGRRGWGAGCGAVLFQHAVPWRDPRLDHGAAGLCTSRQRQRGGARLT